MLKEAQEVIAQVLKQHREHLLKVQKWMEEETKIFKMPI
jgi:hypothetical protein